MAGAYRKIDPRVDCHPNSTAPPATSPTFSDRPGNTGIHIFRCKMPSFSYVVGKTEFSQQMLLVLNIYILASNFPRVYCP
jgi:hypothetical protein